MLHFCLVKITIVGATPYELEALISHHFPSDMEVDYLVHGIGGIHTTYNLTSYLSTHQPDVMIQCGLAGSFNPNIAVGDVVFVRSECFGDMGSEDQDGTLLELFDTDLEAPHAFPFQERKLRNPFPNPVSLPEVNSISVNTVSGSEKTIVLRQKQFQADIESMEGAAFTYTCLHKHIPFVQIRGISNKVEPRNRDQWDMSVIETYSNFIIQNIRSFVPNK